MMKNVIYTLNTGWHNGTVETAVKYQQDFFDHDNCLADYQEQMANHANDILWFAYIATTNDEVEVLQVGTALTREALSDFVRAKRNQYAEQIEALKHKEMALINTAQDAIGDVEIQAMLLAFV